MNKWQSVKRPALRCTRNLTVIALTVDVTLPTMICRWTTSSRRGRPEDSGTDDIENLMPSCRMCNHYKRAHDLETFRRYIAEIPRKLQENYIYKVGVVYGNVLENPKAIKFYFEKVRDTNATD